MTRRKAGPVGIDAFERREWSVAHAELSAADAAGKLSAADLERFAVVTDLIGDEDEGARIRERAHHAWLAADGAPGAARCAFWIGFGLAERGEMARASGWLARAQRVLDEADEDCAERGYLAIPAGLQALDEGNAADALKVFNEVAARGQRFADPDLAALGRLGRGLALVRLGETIEGAAQLDEVMVAVTSSEISPIPSGIIYCAVIEACQEMFDLRRAQEWTGALTEWCESQPDLVPFRGSCLVYRAHIMQLHGKWQEAASEAQRAFERLSEPRPQPAVSAAYYCQAELHRLRGATAEADEAFRSAEEWGRRPEPGRALLRLAEGRVDAASTAIRHALDEASRPLDRVPLLAACVEIMLAAGATDSAASASEELAEVAASVQAPFLEGSALRASAMVELERGEPSLAAERLREALARWRALDAPYEIARTRVVLAGALEALGRSRCGCRGTTARARRVRIARCDARSPAAGDGVVDRRLGPQRADTERARGVEPRRDRHDESLDRGEPHDQREDGRSPPQQHLWEARCDVEGCCNGVRLPARLALTLALQRITHLAPVEKLHRSFDVSPASAP